MYLACLGPSCCNPLPHLGCWCRWVWQISWMPSKERIAYLPKTQSWYHKPPRNPCTLMWIWCQMNPYQIMLLGWRFMFNSSWDVILITIVTWIRWTQLQVVVDLLHGIPFQVSIQFVWIHVKTLSLNPMYLELLSSRTKNPTVRNVYFWWPLNHHSTFEVWWSWFWGSWLNFCSPQEF